MEPGSPPYCLPFCWTLDENQKTFQTRLPPPPVLFLQRLKISSTIHFHQYLDSEEITDCVNFQEWYFEIPFW